MTQQCRGVLHTQRCAEETQSLRITRTAVVFCHVLENIIFGSHLHSLHSKNVCVHKTIYKYYKIDNDRNENENSRPQKTQHFQLATLLQGGFTFFLTM